MIGIRQRSLDVWALDDMVSLIEETVALRGDFPALAVLNLADPRGRDNEEAADLVAGNAALHPDAGPAAQGRRQRHRPRSGCRRVPAGRPPGHR